MVQFNAIEEAIRTVQFIRNKCIRFWMDNKDAGQATLQRLCATLAREFSFAKELIAVLTRMHYTLK